MQARTFRFTSKEALHAELARPATYNVATMPLMALRGFSDRALVCLLAIGGSLTVSSCNLGSGYADFGNDLAKSDAVVIDGPGLKIADGRLSGMLVDPWGDDGAVVVGFRYEADGPHLYMQPFDGAQGCDVGIAYRVIVFTRLDGYDQLIAYLSDVNASGRGTLNFVNHDCKVVYGGIKDAELPSRLFEFPPGFVVQAGDQLLDIDPYAKRTRVMTKNLQFWSGSGEAGQAPYHYYVADGELVVFDDERSERIRVGQAVSEVVFESTDPNKGLFLVDGGRLERYVGTANSSIEDIVPETLAEDACGASLGSFGVQYYSPCSARTLVLRDLDSGIAEPIDSGVSRLVLAEKSPIADGSGVNFAVAYTKPSATDPALEDLWLKPAGKGPQLWKTRLGQFFSASLGESPVLKAIVDSDGTYGRLIRLDADGEATLHEQVVLAYPVERLADSWFFMTDLVDSQGTLVQLSDEGKLTVIAKDVPLRSKRVSPERDPELEGVDDADYYNLGALVTDVGEQTGTLGLMQRDKPKSLEPLAMGVRVGNFEFFRNMAAIGYLDEFDAEARTGRLVVHQTTLDVGSVVSENVQEFTELLWPWEGVLYTVQKGDDYSLWAARAK